MTKGSEWTRDVDTAIALYELVGAPTPVSGDRRPVDAAIGDQDVIEASLAGDTPWDRQRAQDHEHRSTDA